MPEVPFQGSVFVGGLKNLGAINSPAHTLFEHDASATLQSCLLGALDIVVQKHEALGRKVELTLPDEDDDVMRTGEAPFPNGKGLISEWPVDGLPPPPRVIRSP